MGSNVLDRMGIYDNNYIIQLIVAYIIFIWIVLHLATIIEYTKDWVRSFVLCFFLLELYFLLDLGTSNLIDAHVH